jgi:hypothetical protein
MYFAMTGLLRKTGQTQWQVEKFGINVSGA